ncbi:hypothetical protein OG500_27060 [Kitasatospora sp. NBC_01250]|uniref:hypothetical protein n=1 Tax=unclassified Kitasatospora TaxID=2633591 RepID=UPI002E15585A|nr:MULTISPECIES: hypothetical protein [unclassified Kitasatospora]WSJ69778.1 hypothetical protein OG294_28820 [Kitasatospora sp. NBC_01302]
MPSPTGGYRNAPTQDPPYNGPSLPTLPSLDGTLVVDFALIGKAGADAGNAADSMATAWTALSSAALFGAAPWGDDAALGQGFDQQFAQPRDDLLKAIQALPDTLKHLADALGGAHATLKSGDEQSKDLARSFLPPGTGGA